MPARVVRKKPSTKKPAKVTKRAPSKAEVRQHNTESSKPKKKQSVKRGMTFDEKASMLRDYAKQHDWWTELKPSPFLCLTMKKDDGRYKDTIYCEWVDGRGNLKYMAEDGRTVQFRNLAAVMHHLDGSHPIKRGSGKRRASKPRVKTDFEGNVILRRGDEDYKPIGADIVDHFDHLEAVAPKKESARGPKRWPVQRTMLFRPAAKAMKERLEAEGYVVTLTEHVPGSCDECKSNKIAGVINKPVARRRPPAKKVAAKRKA